MKNLFKRNNQTENTNDEPDFLALLKEIKQQLIFLEKKIDVLSNQPKEKYRDRSFSHDRSDRKGGYRDTILTKAICAQCNKVCELPFKPSGDRPVYCKECFSKHNGGSFEGRGEDSRPRSRGFDQEHHGGRNSDNRQDGERHGFGKRRPVGFRKRKGRI